MTKKFANKLQRAAINLEICMAEADVEVCSRPDIETSYFGTYKNGQAYILLKDGCSDRTVGHEYGHYIFRDLYTKYGIYPDCTDIKRICDYYLSMYDSDRKHMEIAIHHYLLDIIYDYSHLNVSEEDIAAISDIFSLYTNGHILSYNGHPTGYVKEFTNHYGKVNRIYEDEWFANICGYLYDENWNALYVTYKLFPTAVKSSLVLLEKAVENLDLEDEDLREYKREYKIIHEQKRKYKTKL